MTGCSTKLIAQARRAIIMPTLAFVLFAAPVLANGWEHWGIPLEVLLKTLQADDAGYRLRAARSLGIRHEHKAVPKLLDLLSDPAERPWVKSEILQALGLIGDARAVPGLIDVLRRDAREELRGAAATALAGLAVAATLDALIEAVESERSLIVQADIVTALGSFNQPRGVSTLIGLIGNDANPRIRRKAIGALGRTGSRAATRPLLAVLAETSSDTEQGLIVEALATIADPAARPALERLIDATGSPALKVRITVALGAVRDGSTVPKLVELLASELAAVRFYAVDALATAGDARAAEPIRRLYRRISGADAPASVQSDRRRMAAYLGDQSLRVAIIRALTTLDAEGSEREFLDAAARVHFPRTSAIGLSLNQGSYELRRAAIVGLGYSRGRRAARFLIESGVLGDRDFRVRATALRALGVHRDPAAAPAIAALLNDAVAEVRWVAAKLLGRLGNAASVPGLGVRLADRHPEVRRQAVLSLGYLGAREACPDLIIRARDDAAQPVRDAARATQAHLCQRAPR